MNESYSPKNSIVHLCVVYLSLGIVVFCVSLVIGVIGLYTLASTVNTCQKRERYSVLSFLEQTVPFVTNPIQRIVCP